MPCPAELATPLYPFRVLTGVEAACFAPGDVVRFGGYLFASVRGEWVVVEVDGADDD